MDPSQTISVVQLQNLFQQLIQNLVNPSPNPNTQQTQEPPQDQENPEQIGQNLTEPPHVPTNPNIINENPGPSNPNQNTNNIYNPIQSNLYNQNFVRNYQESLHSFSSDYDSVASHNQELVNNQTLFQMITKKFDGNRSDLSEFLRICETANKFAVGPQKELLLGYILANITGYASAQLQDKTVRTWYDLKSILKQLFSEKKSTIQLMEELNTIRQFPNETAIQYHQRINRVLTRILNSYSERSPEERKWRAETVREIALQRFVLHSHENISFVLRLRDPRDLSEALDFAQAEEKIVNDRNKPKFKSTRTYPQNQNDSLVKSFETNLNINQGSENNENPRDNHSPNTNNHNIQCRYCKKFGHKIADCRKRKFFNERRQNTASNNSPVPTTSATLPVSQPENEQNVHLNSQVPQMSVTSVDNL